jgi:hypothetical protein
MLESYPDWFEDEASDMAELYYGALLYAGLLQARQEQNSQMSALFYRALEIQKSWKDNSWLKGS